eukprot:6145295-Pyramimonas_sp.AAC.1
MVQREELIRRTGSTRCLKECEVVDPRIVMDVGKESPKKLLVPAVTVPASIFDGPNLKGNPNVK